MNWYKGNIADAVALAKTKNAIFVVYVEGKDDATTKLGSFINDSRIREKLESDDFVAIKIEGDSEPYMQFASIYQVVPVPSIFFIGKAGTPLDITTGVINSVEELEVKIVKVLHLAGRTTTATTINSQINELIREESKASSSNQAEQKEEKKETTSELKEDIGHETSSDNIVCKDGVCFKKSVQDETPKEVNKMEEVERKKQEDEAKLAESRKYLEQKRRERIEEEKRLEKERELQRRKESKEMQNLRNWQRDQELKELKENIKRERLEEQKARERIRAQIAADKAERAHKFAAENQNASSSSSQNANDINTINASTSAAASASDESRLQFRLASGTCNTHNFKCSTTLEEIREYVTRELLPGTGIKEFTLATTYPKRELTKEHNSNTLLELELFPSAVILIIGNESTGPTAIISRNGGWINMFSILVMTILNPIFSLYNSAKNWFTGKRYASGNGGNAQKRSNEEQNKQNDVSKRRNLDRFLSGSPGNTTGLSNQNEGDSTTGPTQGGAYRRYVGGSNIHRLSDNRKDSDDENATWNGNSTQQQ